MARSLSVVVTVRNEEKHLAALLESLVPERHIAEVIVVDSASTDRTVAIARSFGQWLPMQVIVQDTTRAEGRNVGARAATGDLLAFVDGDCRVVEGWASALLRQADDLRVLAGAIQYEGRYAFPRVPVMVNDMDATAPSCNLAYSRALFTKLGGFDREFQTAEDIDLNLRAIEKGASIEYVSDARVIARTRASMRGMLQQAYDYGRGRRQLQEKHPQLPKPRRRAALRTHATPFGVLRLAAGWLGFVRGGWA